MADLAGKVATDNSGLVIGNEKQRDVTFERNRAALKKKAPYLREFQKERALRIMQSEHKRHGK
jgi:hypothetical protein